MKQIGSIRVIVAGHAMERAAAISSQLRDIGLERIETHDLSTGTALFTGADACVVVVDWGDERIPAAPAGLSLTMDSLTAVVLLLPNPNGARVREGMATGYRAVLPADVPVRVLYRRIGALAQWLRRPERMAAETASLARPVSDQPRAD